MSGQGLATELDEIVPLVRRVVRARVHDRVAVDDVVQEALTRVAAAEDRLAAGSLVPYAVVVARNVARNEVRDRGTGRRLAHRALDLRAPADPEAELLAAEERDLVSAALRRLPEQDRALVTAADAHGESPAAIGERTGAAPGTVRVRLLRARARMRVEYVLSLRGASLPTARCRPVLDALSAGDRRRQTALGAGAHLLSCDTCAGLAHDVTAHRRPLAALLPFVSGRARLERVRRHPAKSAAAGAVVAALALGTVAVNADGSDPPGAGTTTTAAAAPSGSAAAPLLPLPPGGLGAMAAAGATVMATDVDVVAVPSDEGFWVGAGGEPEVWVQLVGGGESPFQVRPGQRLSFPGRVVAHDAGFADRVGLTGGEPGAALLSGDGHHVEVDPGDLSLRR